MKSKKFDLDESIKLYKASGIKTLKAPYSKPYDLLNSLVHIEAMLEDSNNGYRLVFVFYDVSNNKLRTLLSKFLLKQGLLRVQKSVFVGNLSPSKFHKVKTALKEIAELYDGTDSYIFLPISKDNLIKMQIAGRNFSIDQFKDRKSIEII